MPIALWPAAAGLLLLLLLALPVPSAASLPTIWPKPAKASSGSLERHDRIRVRHGFMAVGAPKPSSGGAAEPRGASGKSAAEDARHQQRTEGADILLLGVEDLRREVGAGLIDLPQHIAEEGTRKGVGRCAGRQTLQCVAAVGML